ncbi:MAG: penicillin acylase family protein [Gemmatimonadota bacterium]
MMKRLFQAAASWLCPALVFSLALLAARPLQAQNATGDEVTRWERRAENVTIVRDDWGIPHVYGRTDADAVFGLMYAQAEDDFDRVERNYLGALGRLAEAEGKSAIFHDLRMRLFVDPDSMKALYDVSPAWLRELMDAWADGLNYYLYTHPDAVPRAIRRFEPWMPLAFSEGSITNDVTRIPPPQIESFYSRDSVRPTPGHRGSPPGQHGASNAIAIAPSNTAAGHALLLINPHPGFYFRTEVHVISEEGLNAYGAATWGQFFVFQGFNERLGWAHTTSGVDAVDEYLEAVTERDGRFYYRYGDEERPLGTSAVTVPYRTESGALAERTFTVYRTHRGPIIRDEGGRWVSIALMRKPMEALQQSFLRMKAHDIESFYEALELKANSTNNTIYADADGNIAFQPPQFIPRRDDRFDFSQPVDGTDPATDWQGEHVLEEVPYLHNPASGWIQNTNNWPYSAAGLHSARREDFPRYMDTFGENPRGVHAISLLQDRKDFTLESLRDVAYDSYQPAFAQTIPSLIAAYDEVPDSHPLKRRLRAQIDVLRDWDYRWGVGSIAMTVALHWMNELWEGVRDRIPDKDLKSEVELIDYTTALSSTDEKLEALAAVSDRLTEHFGTWRTPWGEINRFQRLSGQVEQPFSDDAPSIPVGFSEGWTGSLAVFYTTTGEDTKKRYGVDGNTFVAVVEFGDRVRAKAIRPGGQSGDPSSPHFDDQALRYATGNLRDVYFYRTDLEGHTERKYRPGGAY